MAVEDIKKKAPETNWPAFLKKEPKVKTIIHEQEGQEGLLDVPLSVNGHVYLVKRGYEVDLPYSVFKVLQNSKYEVPVKDDDGNETLKVIPRFSFSVVGEIPKLDY